MSFAGRLVPGLKAQGLGALGYLAVNTVMKMLREQLKLDRTMTGLAGAGAGVVIGGFLPPAWQMPFLGGFGAESTRMVAQGLGINFLSPANYGGRQLADATGEAQRLLMANADAVNQLESAVNDALSQMHGAPVRLRGPDLVQALGRFSAEMRNQKAG